MLTILHEVHFWTQTDVITIKDSDFGAFKYLDKKLLPPQNVFFEGKKAFMLKRGMMVVPFNKRPNKIREALKELEDTLCHHRVVVCEWRTSTHLYLVIANGAKISIKVNPDTGDLEEICHDKLMLGKLASQYLSDVGYCQNQAIFTYADNQVTQINFIKPSAKFEFEKKWSSLDPKIQVLDLCGPLGRRVNRHVTYNSNGSLILVWWKCSNDEVYPWTPSVKDEDRANVHVYAVGSSKLELRCFFRTENDPVYISFSSLNPGLIHSIQQRISLVGEVTLEWSIIEIDNGKIETTYVITLLLPTHSCVVALSPKEDRLFIGCIDGSILIVDNANNISDLKKAYFIPSIALWHPDSSLILILNERGQIQWFDRALHSIKSQVVSEDSNPTTILDLSSYFKYQPSLLSAAWNRKPKSSANGKDDMIILRFERGPLVVAKVSCTDLTPAALTRQYLASEAPGSALEVLLSLHWAEDSESLLACLQTFVSHLLKEPLSPQSEALLERALGSYHSPMKPIPDAVIDEVADSVHDLSRRFFHHLLRFQVCNKALSLAVDLGDYDLFMDLHNYGKMIGNSELAQAALQKAEEICYSNSSSSGSSCDCSDSCSCGSDPPDRVSLPPLPVLPLRPPPLPVLDPLPMPPSQARQKVKFSSTVTHIPSTSQVETPPEDLPPMCHNTVGLPPVSYLETDFNERFSISRPSVQSALRSQFKPPATSHTKSKPDEVEPGKIKVVHFGLV